MDAILGVREIEAFVSEMGKGYIIADVVDYEIPNLKDIESRSNSLVIDFGDYNNHARCAGISYNAETEEITVKFDENDISNTRKWHMVPVDDTLNLMLTASFKNIEVEMRKAGFSGFEFASYIELAEGTACVLQVNGAINSSYFNCTIRYKFNEKDTTGKFIYYASISDLAIRQKDSNLLYDYIAKHSNHRLGNGR